MFSGDAGGFSDFGSLTFSIPPDGTHVGHAISRLQSEFNQVGPTAQWLQALSKAFQKWSTYANINVGNVADNGAASGVDRPTRGNDRFGDIRGTGFDYATDSSEVAVSENSRSVGNWAGDVFFNSAAQWNNLAAIEAAALHEIGHILRLEHSDDPASPMHSHGANGILELPLVISSICRRSTGSGIQTSTKEIPAMILFPKLHR